MSKLECQGVQVSDSETCLAHLRANGQVDHGLFLRYSGDDKNWLESIFWADSCSRYDCSCFGDVVGFDATYNKNKYRKTHCYDDRYEQP